MTFSPKFIRKYMHLARQIGAESNPCYARQIGCFIVQPGTHRTLSTGYNGPPAGTPHCDNRDYLRDWVWPQLSQSEKDVFRSILSPFAYHDADQAVYFADKYHGCEQCPRRLVGAASGERLQLCTCAHAEANAIARAGQPLDGAVLFCWCPLPCVECAKLIIAAHIASVHCLEGDYQREGVTSARLLQWANIRIFQHSEEFLDSPLPPRLPVEIPDPPQPD